MNDINHLSYDAEYRALRDSCPQEILEKLQVDYSKG